MRKILSQEEEAKKARRNQFLIGGAMVLIMVASVLGYSLSREEKSNSEKIVYNGIEFTKQSGFWTANTGGYQFFFKYNPQETEKVNSMLSPLKNYADKPLYIYSDSDEAATEIYRNLFYQNQIAERIQSACLTEEGCEGNVPIKTCDSNFIVIRESNSTKSIIQNNSCVFIEGDMGNLTKMGDEFLFKIIGVQ